MLVLQCDEVTALVRSGRKLTWTKGRATKYYVGLQHAAT